MACLFAFTVLSAIASERVSGSGAPKRLFHSVHRTLLPGSRPRIVMNVEDRVSFPSLFANQSQCLSSMMCFIRKKFAQCPNHCGKICIFTKIYQENEEFTIPLKFCLSSVDIGNWKAKSLFWGFSPLSPSLSLSLSLPTECNSQVLLSTLQPLVTFAEADSNTSRVCALWRPLPIAILRADAAHFQFSERAFASQAVTPCHDPTYIPFSLNCSLPNCYLSLAFILARTLLLCP